METFSSAPSRRAIQRSPASSDDSSTLPRSSLPMRSSSYTVNTTVHGLIAQPNEQQRFHSGSSELWTTSLWQVVSPTAIFTHGSDRSSRFRGLTLPSYQWSLCGMWRAASPHARSAGIRRDGVQPRPHRRRESHTQRWQAESHTSRGNLPTRRVAFSLKIRLATGVQFYARVAAALRQVARVVRWLHRKARVSERLVRTSVVDDSRGHRRDTEHATCGQH